MDTARELPASIALWEWLVLLLLLPVALFPAGPQAVLLLLIPFFWLLHLVFGGRVIPRTPFNIALSVVGLMLLVSLTVTFDYALSLTKMAGVLYGIGLLFGSTRLVQSYRSGIWWVLGSVILLGIAMALIGLFNTPWLAPFTILNTFREWLPASLQSVPGTVGGVVNANELAGTLAWIAPLLIACLIGLPRSAKKHGPVLAVTLAITTAFVAGLIFATQSRGGTLALLLGTALVIFLYVPRQWRIVVVVMASVFSLVWYFSYGSALESAAPGAEALGLSSRLEIWSRALAAIGDFPLTGVSLNGFRRIIQVLYPTFLVPPDIDLAHAHNQFLQTALDLGLPGLVGYVSIWFLAAGMLSRNVRRLTHLRAVQHPYYALTAGLLGSLAAGWTFGLLDAISLGARPGFIWWLLIAMSGGVHYLVMYRGESVGLRRRVAPKQATQPTPKPEPPKLEPAEEPEPKREPFPEERPKSRPRMRYRPPSSS